MNNLQFNLRFALSSSTFVLLGSISAIYFGLLIFAIEDIAKNSLQQRLSSAVNLAENAVDVSEHQKLKQKSDELTIVYTNIVKSFRNVRDNIPGIKFIYTVRMINDKLVYIIDCEEKEEDRAKLNELYDDASPYLLNIFNQIEDKVYFEKNYTTDKYGTFLSAYNPVFKNGKVEFVIGTDIKVEDAKRYIRLYKMKFTVVFLGLLTIIVPFVIWMTNIIRRPLYKVRNEILKLKNLDINDDINFKSNIMEVNDMISATQSVKVGLRSFAKYVPDKVVRQLLSQGEEATIGGKKEYVTVLFSDIEGFTNISENNDVQEVVTCLNEYFDVHVTCLENSNATVDKFIGDAVMTFWNAPVKVENHELVSVLTALTIKDEIIKLNEKWKIQGKNFIFKTRIGINCGEVIVGNIGSSHRINYTVTGDTVNLASRLEAENKNYDTTILVSESIYMKTCNSINYDYIGIVKVKGKEMPVKIYSPNSVKM